MQQAFCISDIHGCDKELELLLQFWQPETQKLIFVGDYIDRGESSVQVIERLMLLVAKYGEQVCVLKGNHEAMLLEFVEAPLSNLGDRYLRNGGIDTLMSFMERAQIRIDSYYDEAAWVAKYMQTYFNEELTFIRNMPHVTVYGRALFTHAGFNTKATDWQQTSNDQFLWTRKHYEYPNTTGLRNFFGHTPTNVIRGNEDYRIWQHDSGEYVGIDGGCVYGGQLQAVIIDEQAMIQNIFSIKKGMVFDESTRTY